MVQRHYRGEADKDVFYRIPKMLFINPKYQNMALDAKVLYGLLLDRMGLSSTKEEWQDEDGSIYIIFRQKEAMKLLNVKGKEKIVKLYKELEQAELIERVKQGINRPDKIYVGKVEVYPAPNNQPTPPKPSYPHDKPDSDGHTPDNPEFGNRNPDEGGFVNRTPGVLESKPGGSINETPPSNIYSNDTHPVKSIYPRPYQPTEAHQPPKTPKIDRVSKSSEYRQYFEKHLGYEEILWGLRNEEETYTREEVDELITLMADECGSKKAYVRISGTDYRREDVARRLMNMDNTAFERILYALKWRNPDIIISNRRAYLLTTLFNWPTANPTPYEE